MNYLSIKRNKRGVYTLCRFPIQLSSNFKAKKNYSFKLDNSISRSRNKIFDYIQNNDFYYFVTLTLKDNRFDLFNARKKITQLISNMRKRGYDDLFFILIPEFHKSGAIHFHGLFSKGFRC